MAPPCPISRPTLGLGRQSLYNTFGDKRELYLKALDLYQRQATDGMVAMLQAPDAGLDALERWLAASAATVAVPGGPDGVLHRKQHRRAPGRRSHGCPLHPWPRMPHAAIRKVLSQAQAKGEIPAERDVEGLVGLVVAHVYGLAVLARAGTTERELRAASEALMAVVR